MAQYVSFKKLFCISFKDCRIQEVYYYLKIILLKKKYIIKLENVFERKKACGRL